MCDLGLTLGLGLLEGIATAAGEAQTASANMDQSIRQTKLEHAAQEQERLIQVDGANKEGYQAQLEGDRTASAIRAMGEGMGGATAGQQVAEQRRQTALSIENAKDRKSAANANYAMAGKHSQINAQNDINRQAISPMTSFFNIAASSINRASSFDAFPSGKAATTPTGRFK